MARYRLDLEYEGTRYSGWQKQENAKTIQGILTDAAQQVFNAKRIDLQGSGRTDSGVHALHQVAHFDAHTSLREDQIQFKFNDLLPADINIIKVTKSKPNFHCRHDAVSRSYIYQIANRRTGLYKRYVWWVKDKLNADRMRSTARLLVGMHDFRSFSDQTPGEEQSTKVLVEELRIEEFGELIVLRIRASHFLWKMVRRVTGVLAEAGKGTIDEKEVLRFLSTHTRNPAGFTAPPSGLFLERVYYKGDGIEKDLTPVIRGL